MHAWTVQRSLKPNREVLSFNRREREKKKLLHIIFCLVWLLNDHEPRGSDARIFCHKISAIARKLRLKHLLWTCEHENALLVWSNMNVAHAVVGRLGCHCYHCRCAIVDSCLGHVHFILQVLDSLFTNAYTDQQPGTQCMADYVIALP